MSRWFHPHRCICQHQPSQFRLKLLPSVILFLLLSGCTPLSTQFLRLSGQVPEATLDLQATADNQPGIYNVTGSTNLPDRTQLTVAAVRYLYPVDSVSLNPNPTYAILDYRAVEVMDGQWQAQLNLWEVATNGRYQESWQLDQPRTGLSVKPAEDVVFLATLAPTGKLSNLEQQLDQRGIRLAKGMVRSTSDGQRYAQVSQQVTIALPTRRTTPAPPRPEDINFGWGYRYLIPDEPQNPTQLERPETRQTDAPPAPEAFLQ